MDNIDDMRKIIELLETTKELWPEEDDTRPPWMLESLLRQANAILHRQEKELLEDG